MSKYVLPAIFATVPATVLQSCPEPTGTGVRCVKVGFTYPDVGNLSSQGEWHRTGTDFWAKEVNKNGVTVNGLKHYVELTGLPDNGNRTRAVELYDQMRTDGIEYFLGPYGSSYTRETATELQKTGHVMVAANAAAGTTYSETLRPNLFGLSTTAEFYTGSALELLKAEGAKTAAILQSDNFFTKVIANGAEAELDRLDYRLLERLTYEEDNYTEEIMADLLKNITSYDADVFLSLSQKGDGVVVMRQLANTTYKPDALILLSAGADREELDKMGDNRDGILGLAQWFPHEKYEDDFYGSGDEWVVEYEKVYGDRNGVPSYIAAAASAAGYVLMEAITGAADTTQAALAAELKTLDLVTFFGPVRFDTDGSNSAKPMVTSQVQKNIITVVAPNDQAEGEIVYPIGADSAATSLAASSITAVALVLCTAALF